MANAVSGKWLTATPTAIGVRAIAMFDMAGPDHSTDGWHFQVGVRQSTTEGNPSAPCLQLTQPGAWRFRWAVKPGARTIAIYCKQVAGLAPYPSITVKANSDCGVSVDVSASAGAGAGWKQIGPVAVTVSSAGVLWVELRANYAGLNPANGQLTPWDSCFFDHIVLT